MYVFARDNHGVIHWVWVYTQDQSDVMWARPWCGAVVRLEREQCEFPTCFTCLLMVTIAS